MPAVAAGIAICNEGKEEDICLADQIVKSLRLEERKEQGATTSPKQKTDLQSKIVPVKARRRLLEKQSPPEHISGKVLQRFGKQRIDSLERQFRSTNIGTKKPRI